MVLVDTSVWIDHLRGTRRLDTLLRPKLIATCPPVVQEVLNGTGKRAPYVPTRELVLTAMMLDDPMPLERFEEAAQIYLRCRDKGYTIRSSVDCLIAACAIANGVELLHNDSDFQEIAKVAPLKLFTPSPA